MIDIETLGSQSQSVILSVGAVLFDIKTGEMGREFYKRIDIDSCLKSGLKVNGDTIEWWLNQNQKARKEIGKSTVPFKSALTQFTFFFAEETNYEGMLWGNSARFDLGILRDAYNACDLKAPWSYKQELDVRTMAWLKPEIVEQAKAVRKSTEHHAIEDCKFQINYLCKIYKAL